MILNILLNIHGDLMGLLRIHGVDESHYHTIVPIPGDKGVHVTIVCHGLQQSVEELHDIVTATVIIRIDRTQFFGGRDVEILDVRFGTRLCGQQHVDETNVLCVGAGETDKLMAAHPLFHRLDIRQHICLVEDTLRPAGIGIPASKFYLVLLALYQALAHILDIEEFFRKGFVDAGFRHRLLTSNRHGHGDNPGHDLIQTFDLLNGD